MARYQRRDREREDRQFEAVIKINRCATVVKGGRRFSFSALVVVGDQAGRVGIGFGKANEVPSAVEKAVKEGQRNMEKISLKDRTIPHPVTGRFGAAKVVMMPASPGTGLIAGSAVRAVVEACGIGDILTKSHGSTNPVNLTKAAWEGLKQLRTKEQVAAIRGVEL